MGLFGPSFAKVWGQGAPAPGTLVGIRRSQVNEDESTYEVDDYAIDVGGEVIGVRQKLNPRDEVRLGMPVTVHRTGKAAVIRWGSPVDNRWKAVKPPLAGIEDKIDSPPKGWVPGEVEVLEIGARSAVLGLATVVQAKVRFRGPAERGAVESEALVDKFYPPFYAAHLGATGSRLPAHQHPRDARKIRIDWPAAALADPGVGAKPLAGSADAAAQSGQTMGAGAGGSLPAFGKQGLLDRAQAKLQSVSAGMMGFDAEAGPAAEDPVAWETFLAVSVAIKNEPGTPADEVARRHGIPAGEWAAVNKRWMGRIMTDWKLGAAYGEALS
jgi:hypothetical protein